MAASSEMLGRVRKLARSMRQSVESGFTAIAPDSMKDELSNMTFVYNDAANELQQRKARIDDRIERFSVSRSLGAVDRGDLILHVIDGPENVTDQDAQILSYAVERGNDVAGVVMMTQVMQTIHGQETKIPPPPVAPPEKRAPDDIGATGILEAKDENVAIGVPLPGLVKEVKVKVNQVVKAGEPLWFESADDVVALASERSVGMEVSYGEDDVLKVYDLAKFDFKGINIALSSPGA